MALYIFQFGLLQPIASIFNSQWPIAAFTVSLLFIMLLNNKFIVKDYVALVLAIFSTYFMINALIYKESSFIILPVFIEFILKSFSGFIIGSLDTDGEMLYDAFLKIGLLNFFAIVLYPFVDFLDSMNYMRFGYAMVPSVIMFLFALFDKEDQKIGWLLALLTSFILTVMYGSRGALVVFLVLGLLLFLFSKRIKFANKIKILVFGVLIIMLVLKYNLIVRTIDYLYHNLGIETYALMKFRRMFDGGFWDASSGRDRIYKRLLSHIKEKPTIGNGIGFAQKVSGFTSHNLFLQVLIESGLIGLLIWICLWIYCIKKYKFMAIQNEDGFYKIATLLISVSLGRLLFSSDYWLRPEYWFVLSMLINFKPREYMKSSN